MCGIVSVIGLPAADVSAGVVRKMTAAVHHRGPDDAGTAFFVRGPAGWQPCAETDPSWSVALGCTRLSILDLSAAGHMPMAYGDRLWIAYNGEVYNFIEIRSELEQLGHTFRSATDTEVILAAYAQWGPDCFARFRGMWGIVILDGARGEVILCRDRLGIKPLYLWQGAGMVAIVSEIKQLRHLPAFTPRMQLATVAEYLHTGYEDPRRSFFRDVRPVPAGSWLTIHLDTLAASEPADYWHPERVQIAVSDAPEAGRLFAKRLRESVRLHLRSDVPVGCALSGGMDSSSIAVLVDEVDDAPTVSLNTFSCTFPGDATDEREYVDAVTSDIGAVPYYVTPDPATFLEDLDQFVYCHDEPVGGLSVYASYCIARLTRQAGIPVTLNGQGGDEVLAGYWQSYFLYLRELAKHGHLLRLMTHVVGASMANGNRSLLEQVPVMLRRYRARGHPQSLVQLRDDACLEQTTVLQAILAMDEQAQRVAEIRHLFLPRLLKWDDRNSMAFSVEGRYPFLDHELIELCLSFAPEILYHRGWTKWPLRLGLSGVLPPAIRFRRSKFGFEVPQDKWLCGPLRPLLEGWLKQDRMLWDYVEHSQVRRLAHQAWQLNGKRSEPGQALLRLFLFDRWSQVFGVAA
jgi:asparagine synthase (glutamine-hydrolysing)